jgi:hypothetical protein
MQKVVADRIAPYPSKDAASFFIVASWNPRTVGSEVASDPGVHARVGSRDLAADALAEQRAPNRMHLGQHVSASMYLLGCPKWRLDTDRQGEYGRTSALVSSDEAPSSRPSAMAVAQEIPRPRAQGPVARSASCRRALHAGIKGNFFSRAVEKAQSSLSPFRRSAVSGGGCP